MCLRIEDLAPEGSQTASSSNATASNGTWTPPCADSTVDAISQTWASQNNMTRGGWVFRLANIRLVPIAAKPGFRTVPGSGKRIGRGVQHAAAAASAAVYAATTTDKSVPFGMPGDALGASGTAAELATYSHFKPSPAMLEFERRVRQEGISDAQQGTVAIASADVSAVTALHNSPEGKWQQLQQKYNWMEGQMVFRSLFRLCVSDAAPGCIETCG
jgi:hypothetical protein